MNTMRTSAAADRLTCLLGAGLLALPLLTACSTSMPTEAVGTTEPMSAGAEPDTMRYVNPKADLHRYTRFIIDPVEIYKGADATFGSDVSDADKQALAAFMHQEFTRTLSQRYQVVTTPGPNTLRIHLTLAGAEMTRPALATVTHALPAGLAINLVKGGTGGQGSFMGSVTIAGDFYDSMTNELVGAVLTKQYPNAMDVTEVVSGLGAAKAGVTDAAQKLASAVDKIQATGQVPAARR